jgi:hypothetical protein
VIFPDAMVVRPYGTQLAHKLNKRQLELGIAVFLLFVSGRFSGVWWGEGGNGWCCRVSRRSLSCRFSPVE